MRNPGGVLICEGDVREETDTFTCKHCCKVVFVRPSEKPEDIGGFCRRCMSLICGPCVDLDKCRPIEKWLEEQERSIENAIERRRLYQEMI